MPRLLAVSVFNRHCECIFYRSWTDASTNVSSTRTTTSVHTTVHASNNGTTTGTVSQLSAPAIASTPMSATTTSVSAAVAYPYGIPIRRAKLVPNALVVTGEALGPVTAATPDTTAPSVCPRSLDDVKLLYGVLFFLRDMTNKIALPERLVDPGGLVTSFAGSEQMLSDPAAAATIAVPQGDATLSFGQGFASFLTPEYKLHFLETASKTRVVFMTTCDVPDLQREMWDFFNNVIVQELYLNPYYDPELLVRVYLDAIPETYLSQMPLDEKGDISQRELLKTLPIPPPPLMEARGLAIYPNFAVRANAFFNSLPIVNSTS